MKNVPKIDSKVYQRTFKNDSRRRLRSDFAGHDQIFKDHLFQNASKRYVFHNVLLFFLLKEANLFFIMAPYLLPTYSSARPFCCMCLHRRHLPLQGKSLLNIFTYLYIYTYIYIYIHTRIFGRASRAQDSLIFGCQIAQRNRIAASFNNYARSHRSVGLVVRCDNASLRYDLHIL